MERDEHFRPGDETFIDRDEDFGSRDGTSIDGDEDLGTGNSICAVFDTQPFIRVSPNVAARG